MSWRRRLAIRAAAATTAAAGMVLLGHPAAGAVDMWGNVGPASQLPSGSLVDAYPLGNYALDHHFSAVDAGVFSGVDVSGIAPTVAWLLANLLWQLTALLASAVITLFTFAFSLDLVNGSAATGGAGALGPVSDAVRSIYRDVFGAAWLTVAVLLAGMWSMWQALVRRRYTETAGALGLSLLYIVIALAFVTQPERTIGQASKWTNEVSAAFLSLAADGSIGEAQRAKQDSSDHLFELLVYQPWVVLQFGGTEHCVRNAGSDDPDDVRVRPLSPDPARDEQLARQLARSQQIEADDGKVCVNNRRKYAPHFLRFEPGSKQRNAQHEALEDGDTSKVPDEDPGKADGSYRLSSVDKPATDAMGKSGQYQRLGLAVVIFGGELGAFLLLGALAVSVIVAQVLVLLLLAFAPVALVVGTFPGRGHQFFLDWLSRLAAFLVKKAIYSLILAVLLAVSAALQDATSNLGWFMAWGMQAVFFWAVFLHRKQLAGGLTSTVTGASGQREEARLIAGLGAGYAMARLLRRTVGGVAAAAVRRPPPSGRRRSPPRAEPLSPQPPAPPLGPLPPRGASSSAAPTTTESVGHDDQRSEPDGQATRTSRSASAAPSSQPASAVDGPTPPNRTSSTAADELERPQAHAASERARGNYMPPVDTPPHDEKPSPSKPATGTSTTPQDREAEPPTPRRPDRHGEPLPAQRPRVHSSAPERPAAPVERAGVSSEKPAAEHPLTASVRADGDRLRTERRRPHLERAGDGDQLHPPTPELPRSRPSREGGEPQ